jgi:hypothetical protein
MQKGLISFVSIAGVLLGATTLMAADWPSDPSRSGDNPQQRAILLTSGMAQMAEGGSYEAPPPAPGIGGVVPPGPTAPLMAPVPEGGPVAAGGPPIAMAPGLALYPRPVRKTGSVCDVRPAPLRAG